ncbi:MAG: NAD(P)-binding domain-containing protein [Thaumarchaeota archaeon]|nr:NAD(P)-binding domain-containing protein [Nitrososphaerota archaeon]
MRVAVLGTGDVGLNLGTRLVQVGHEVKMGSRTADNQKAIEWSKTTGPGASHGTFADAASFGEIVFNCTSGVGSLEALKMAGEENLKGKVLVDVSNPLDFSRGMPPTLAVCNTDSLGEQIQRSFPEVRVVKALNMVGHDLHANPERVPGDHDALICGNDSEAKAQVTKILKDWFGWKSVIDLGDIAGSRGMEMYLTLWLRLAQAGNWAPLNIKVVRPS